MSGPPDNGGSYDAAAAGNLSRRALLRNDETRDRLGLALGGAYDASPPVVCKTVAVPGGSYPAGTMVYFYVAPVDVGGDEGEGLPVTLTAAGEPFLAFCLSADAPPPGTPVIVERSGGRFVFDW